MTKKVFVATVQLVIVAEDEVTADDVINNLLTESEKLYDWNYLKVGKQRLAPTRNYDYIHSGTAMLREKE